MAKALFRYTVPALIAVWLVVLICFPPHRERGGGELPVLGTVSGFVLTNQFGELFRSESLAGAVWVGDIFFSRCPGPCVRMAENLRRLQDGLPAASTARIVSLTADAAFDQPEVLKRYSERFGADSNRWSFLTGPQSTIYRAATEQLLLAVAENPDPESAAPSDLFLHSTRLVLVDQAGRIRGFFDGEARADVDRLLEAIRMLESQASSSSSSSP